MFIALYTDKGPRGICGQSMEITCEWNKAFLFETEERMMEWLSENKDITSNTARKKPSITLLYPNDHPCQYLGCSVEVVK